MLARWPASRAIVRGTPAFTRIRTWEGSMSGTSLRDFVSRAVEHKRIRFGDLRRLQRDILPARITGLEQAEVLIALDSFVDKADREWRRHLSPPVRDPTPWRP